MTWSVNDILLFTQFLLRKNQSASITAKNLFYAWNSEQSSYFDDLKGRWESRNNGKEGNNTGLLNNETILTALTPFTIQTVLSIIAHKITKPENFAYELGLRIDGQQVFQLNHGQKYAVTNSVIDPPSTDEDKYYAIPYQNYYDLLPTTLPTASITTAELDYLVQPTDIIWGFSFDAQNRQVYNVGNSVQPQWLQGDIITITKRTLSSFGVSYHDKDFENFGKTTQATGE